MMASETEGKPIRIVHCIGSMRVGGAERQLAEFINRLPEGKFDQSLILFEAVGAILDEIQPDKCKIHDLGYHHQFRPFNPLSYWRILRALFRTIRILRRDRADIVHGYMYWANMLVVLAGKLAGVPAIVTSRLSLESYEEQRSFKQPLENLANRFTTAIFANSEAVRHDVLLHEEIDSAKIQVIYNGVDTEAFLKDRDSALANELGLDPEDFVLLTIARLHPCKGHEDLLSALRQIKSDHPTIRAMFCGGDRGTESRLRELAKECGLESDIIFLGERSDIAELLALCDLVVHPSHEEGFSNAILEAMAAGKPVVATDVGGAAEAIVEGETGMLVRPHAPGDLAIAISRLASDRERTASMGEAGRKRIQAEFSMQTATERFASFYESLALKSRKGQSNESE